MPMTDPDCSNLNHRRANAPVRACPACGRVVNRQLAARTCSAEQHARARRNHDKYCVHCAVDLMASPQR
jgi:hypothetical protein